MIEKEYKKKKKEIKGYSDSLYYNIKIHVFQKLLKTNLLRKKIVILDFYNGILKSTEFIKHFNTKKKKNCLHNDTNFIK